jgi:hypothetical protein
MSRVVIAPRSSVADATATYGALMEIGPTACSRRVTMP